MIVDAVLVVVLYVVPDVMENMVIGWVVSLFSYWSDDLIVQQSASFLIPILITFKNPRFVKG